MKRKKAKEMGMKDLQFKSEAESILHIWEKGNSSFKRDFRDLHLYGLDCVMPLGSILVTRSVLPRMP